MYINQLDIPKYIISEAYEYHGELAWPRDCALEVLKIAESSGVSVLGVDVWIPTPQGPLVTAFIYDWSSESSQDNQSTWQLSPANFIKDFTWAAEDMVGQGKQPYFVFTLTGRGGAAAGQGSSAAG